MKKILIISANFYQDISEMLIVGAVQELKDSNFDYELINTLGALEIPAIISMAVKI